MFINNNKTNKNAFVCICIIIICLEKTNVYYVNKEYFYYAVLYV